MTRLSVPDMSCGHCKAAVETALTALPGVRSVLVDLGSRQVEVTGQVEITVLVTALDRAGYAATVVAG